MFQSFTGNSRKPRQVNLSGQNSSTRKILPSSQKPNAASLGGQAAVAQAHAQRLQRGHERDRLNASRLVQRVWRGHSSRQKTRDKWRAEWDQHELARTSRQSPDVADMLRVTSDEGDGALPYISAAECYIQMRLLLHFLDIKLEMDRARLTYFGKALQRTLEEVPSIATGDSWTLQLFRLSRFIVNTLGSLADMVKSADAVQIQSLLSILLFLARLIPKHMARNAQRYYRMIVALSSPYGHFSKKSEAPLAKAVLALLTPITSETMAAYTAFGTELLTASDTLSSLSAERLIAPSLNYKMLTTALSREFDKHPATKARILGHSPRCLWLLAHLIFLHRHSLGATGSFNVLQETDYIRLLSTLLAAQSAGITHRIDVVDESMVDTAKRRPFRMEFSRLAPLPTFVREQILSLIQKTSIVGLMSQIELTMPSEQQTGSESAQALATFVLTLIRVFPGQRADEVRLWLYDGSANLKTSTGTSAILYFWHYSRSTAIFQKISQDHHNAVPLLRTFLGIEQLKSGQALQNTQQEWRTLLLFLELYSFAIRHMDDEGFLAGGQFGTAGSTQWGTKIRESSLPLKEVRELVVFLKNLAFALYWNSKDLQEGDSLEEESGLGAYFGTTAPNNAKSMPTKGGDASQESARIQLRDLVTGLLRSIHQRE
jgi:ubiquitin-protein ligase E3 C